MSVAVFAAALGPGYVFLRVEERRRPRASRSSLVQTVELAAIGATAFAISSLIVVSVGLRANWIETSKLAQGRSTYILQNGDTALALLVATLVLAYLIAWVAARLWLHGSKPSIFPISAWHEALEERSGTAPYVVLSLRDGRQVAGSVRAYTVDDRPLAERELVVASPEIKLAEAQLFEEARHDAMIVQGGDVQTVAVIEYQTVLPLPMLILREFLILFIAAFVVVVGVSLWVYWLRGSEEWLSVGPIWALVGSSAVGVVIVALARGRLGREATSAPVGRVVPTSFARAGVLPGILFLGLAGVVTALAWKQPSYLLYVSAVGVSIVLSAGCLAVFLERRERREKIRLGLTNEGRLRLGSLNSDAGGWGAMLRHLLVAPPPDQRAA